MRIKKLVLSIIFLSLTIIIIKFSSHESLGVLDRQIGYFIFTWIAVSIVGLLVFIFRISGFISNRASLWYILLGTFDFGIGALGIVEIIVRNATGFTIAALLLLGTLGLGLFFLVDAFRQKVVTSVGH